MAEKRVEHRTYGRGVVKGERYQGNELLVEFQDGIGRWIPAREIRVSESDILKMSIQALQKSARLHPLITNKKVPEPSKSIRIYPDAQPVNPDLFEDTVSETLTERVAAGKLQDTAGKFDLFEPEPDTDEKVPGSEDAIPVQGRQEPDDTQLRPTIDELLKKTQELEQTPDQKVILQESDLIKASDHGLRKSRPRIKIIEELLVPDTDTKQQFQSANLIPSQPSAGEAGLTVSPIISITTDSEADAVSVQGQDKTGLSEQDIPKSQALREIKTAGAAGQIRPCTPDRFEARRVIEALRLGVVPHRKIEDFSCGREKESEILETWLDDPEKACMFFSGEYGSGKSHMLEISAAKALKNNWAVAVIEIDPDETPFNQPKKIYRQIARSFVWQDGENLSGFREFILKILNSKKKKKIETLSKHPFLGSLLKAWLERSDETTYCLTYDKTDLLLWVEGEEINPPGLPRLHGYQNSANIYCNLLSGLGWAARHVAGLRGLLILIDEGEGIDKGWYSAYQFSRAGNCIKGLVLMANSEKVLHQEYDYMKRHAFPRGNKTGKYTELLYGGTSKQSCSFLWQEESHVKILFSFTPYIVPFVYENIIHDEEVCRKIPEIALEELQEKDLDLLYHKINALYDSAYEFSSQNSIFPILPKDKTRLFVKSVVEALDVMRFNPDTYREELGIADFAEHPLPDNQLTAEFR